jgi:hypothetical protein
MAAKLSLAELRELIGAVDGSNLRATRSFSLIPTGVPQGCLIEISGFGKTELLSVFLREHPELLVAWLEMQITVNPYALWQRGVNVDHMLFIEAHSEPLWCVQQILKSQLFQVVVMSGLRFQELELRKLQLLVEKSQSHLILLSHQLHQSWVPALQMVVQNAQPQILRRRGV